MDRPLGGIERMFWLGRELSPLNVAIAAHLKGAVSVDRLAEVFARMQLRHPLLRVRVVARPDLCFTSDGVGPIPLRVIERAGPDHWRAALERELDRHWHDGPLLHVTVLHSPAQSDILCTYPHAIGDGLSGMYLMQDLLMDLAGQQNRARRLAEPPPLEALVPPLPDPPTRMVRRLLQLEAGSVPRAAGRLTRSLPQLLTSARKVRDDRTAQARWIPSWRTRLIQHTVPPDLRRKLVARCREEQTTIHGALCAAMLVAAAERERAKSPRVFSCSTGISLRSDLTQQVGKSFGLYAGARRTLHLVSTRSALWDIARDVKAQLDAITGSQENLLSGLRMTGRIPTFRNPFLRFSVGWLLTGFPEYTYLVSTLGKYNLPEKIGDLEIESCHLSGSPSSYQEFTLGAVTTNDQLICDFTYADPYTPESTAQRLSCTVMEHLRAAAT